jgi:hypothetical protein
MGDQLEDLSEASAGFLPTFLEVPMSRGYLEEMQTEVVEFQPQGSRLFQLREPSERLRHRQ